MGWARMDDRRHTNKKLNAACAIDPLKGMAANGLDANGITYCAANETDGFVDDASLVQLMPGATKKLRADVTGLLITVDRWTRDEERCGWWIRNYLDFNPARADLEKKRADDVERKRKQRRNGDGSFQAESGRKPSGLRTDSTGSHTVPGHTDPIPAPPIPSQPSPSQAVAHMGTSSSSSPLSTDDDDLPPWAWMDAERQADLPRAPGAKPIFDRNAWLREAARRSYAQHGAEVATWDEPTHHSIAARIARLADPDRYETAAEQGARMRQERGA